MDNKSLKKVAEILVLCGYAAQYKLPSIKHKYIWRKPRKGPQYQEHLNPFADTYVGHMQAFALEDWLICTHESLWKRSALIPLAHGDVPAHQWRLDRIEWCIKQLVERDEDEAKDRREDFRLSQQLDQGLESQE